MNDLLTIDEGQKLAGQIRRLHQVMNDPAAAWPDRVRAGEVFGLIQSAVNGNEPEAPAVPKASALLNDPSLPYDL